MIPEPVCSKKQYILHEMVNKYILITIIICTLIFLPASFGFTCIILTDVQFMTREYILALPLGITIVLDLFLVSIFINAKKQAYEYNLLSNKQIQITMDYYKEYTMDGEKKIPWEEFFSITEKNELYILVLAEEHPRIWDKRKLIKEQIEILEIAIKKNKTRRKRSKEEIKNQLQEEAKEDVIYDISYGFKTKFITIFSAVYGGILPNVVFTLPFIVGIVATIGGKWNIALWCALGVVPQLITVFVSSYWNSGFKETIVFLIINEECIWISDQLGKYKFEWKEIKGIMESKHLFYVVIDSISRIPIYKHVLKENEYALLKEKTKPRNYFKCYFGR